MEFEAKFIPEEKALRLVNKVMEAVRSQPNLPRAIYADGKPTVYIVHEELWKTITELAKSVTNNIRDKVPASVHPDSWHEVKDGQSIQQSLVSPGSIFDRVLNAPFTGVS